MEVPFSVRPYLAQRASWPTSGRHILAHHDDTSVIVYQAYRPSIAIYAVANQRFGGEFSLGRMSWIKPNFLWMMYRCGWGTKDGQERVLAVRLQRAGFDEILRRAEHSSYQADVYASHDAWRDALRTSDVRLQWDPDHSPTGHDEERRAIQLGMSGDTLRRYAHEWIIAIHDISEMVAAQRDHASPPHYDRLVLPAESVYPVADVGLARRLRISA